MIEIAALLLTGLLIPVGIGLVILHSRMLRMMRLEHAAVWESLGRPKLFFAKTISETLKTLRYLWGREYLALKDRKFVRTCQGVRALHIAFLANILLAMVLFAIAVYSVGSVAQHPDAADRDTDSPFFFLQRAAADLGR